MIGEDWVQQVSESLYSAALRRVPPDTLQAREAGRLSARREAAIAPQQQGS